MHIPFLLLLLTITQAGARYSFTLYNNRAEGYYRQAVHTWLSFGGPDGPVYFNFIPITNSSAQGLKPALGKRTKVEKLAGRNWTESYTQGITMEQYSAMKKEIEKFYSCFRFYSRYPQGVYDTYNDVTACRRILSAGGVAILDGIEDPQAVGERIERVKAEQLKVRTQKP